METRLAMVLAGNCEAASVTALSAELGTSRQGYYRLRYLAEGPAGLAPRSRRPHSCLGAVDPALESVTGDTVPVTSLTDVGGADVEHGIAPRRPEGR